MFKVTSPITIPRAIFALSLVSLVVMMGSSMATPSLALYAGEYSGANEFMIGAVIAGFAVGRLLFDIPAGYLADKAGISRTMVLGLAVLVGSSVLSATAPNYGVLLFSRVIEGVGSAMAGIVQPSTIAAITTNFTTFILLLSLLNFVPTTRHNH